MGRQPKKIEKMKKEIDVLLLKMINVSYRNQSWVDSEVHSYYPLNSKYHYEKLAKFENKSERERLILTNNLYQNFVDQFMPTLEKLQNDFTPKERITILKMFNKN